MKILKRHPNIPSHPSHAPYPLPLFPPYLHPITLCTITIEPHVFLSSHLAPHPPTATTRPALPLASPTFSPTIPPLPQPQLRGHKPTSSPTNARYIPDTTLPNGNHPLSIPLNPLSHTLSPPPPPLPLYRLTKLFPVNPISFNLPSYHAIRIAVGHRGPQFTRGDPANKNRSSKGSKPRAPTRAHKFRGGVTVIASEENEWWKVERRRRHRWADLADYVGDGLARFGRRLSSCHCR